MKALVVIDMQNDYFPGGRFPLWGARRAGKQVAALLAEYRAAGIPIFHVRHVMGAERASDPNSFFIEGTKGADIHPLAQPLPSEPVLTKKVPNSFTGTGLNDLLREKGVTELHIAGAMTNMCVDTTVRAAFDLGYRTILHERACAARGVLGTNILHFLTVKTLGSVFATVVK
jgi:nicotinamidase-related amidase